MFHGLMLDLLILLAAAVVSVSLFHRLGLGAVLGYLVAGLVVGPSGFKLIYDTENLMHVSEFGVVFLLFIIGLELEPKRLWGLRNQLLGYGLGQISIVTLAVMGLGLALGFSPAASFVAGIGLALSSTAIAVQILKDRNLFATPSGQSAFSILLFQDIAVIPVLALIPLMAGAGAVQAEPPSILKILLAVIGTVLAGHFLLRPVFRVIASSHLREVFTALCLLFVMGLAGLMHSLGASMALGAFLGGVLLATSEYRHAIETDIEPFKGLLLGLFFISVGMALDLTTVLGSPGIVALLVVGILVLKICAHTLLGLVLRMSRPQIPFFSLVLSQTGEFAFVLFALAASLAILTEQQKVLLSAAVAITMMTTPILTLLYEKLIEPRLSTKTDLSGETVENENPEVIIAGFGRVGQIVARLLFANRIKATVLDHDPDQIESLRRFGFKVYYGDATREDLLHTAGAQSAKILVVAVDSVETCMAVVDMAKEHFPHLKIVARARNINHVYQLMDRGVEVWERETFESALKMGSGVLTLLGYRPYQALQQAHKFRDYNLKMIDALRAQRSDQSKMVSVAKQARDDLAQFFEQEEARLDRRHEGWDQGV